MKRSLVFMGLFLAGCSQSASPQLANGAYYMVGDADCVDWFYQSKPGLPVRCQNKDRQTTGYRTPLTDQELMMYQMSQAQRPVYVPPTPAPVVYPQMKTPQVIPIGRQTGNVTCINRGIYTNCRY
jgi:hypothetical protein